VQLELPKVGEGRLRESIRWLLQFECDGVRGVTMEKDYEVRADWCLKTFGDCLLGELCGRAGYEKMREVMKRELEKEDGMKRVSLKKRFQFLIRVLKIAANRELVDRARIPEMPHMMNDGVTKDAHHTYVQYLAFRAVLPSVRHRGYYDLGWWSGLRRVDLESITKEQVNPWRPFTDNAGKLISMGARLVLNHKRRQEKFTPYWAPMEPEFRQCMIEYYQQCPMSAEDPIVGKFSKPNRWMDSAAIRAGVPRISPHSFRHSRMTYLESIGVHPDDARYAVGASSVKVLRDHYLHPNPETLRRLIPKKRRTDDDEIPLPVATT